MADLNQVFAGAFVSFYAFFERELESLFLGMLSGRLVHPVGDVQPLVTFASEDVARQVVFGGRNYADWLPYDRHLKDRAKLFYRVGLPFVPIQPSDKEALEDLGVVRNALAHQSKHSLAVFQARFIEGQLLPASQQNPASYLRGLKQLNQTRFEYFLGRAVSTLRGFCV